MFKTELSVAVVVLVVRYSRKVSRNKLERKTRKREEVKECLVLPRRSISQVSPSAHNQAQTHRYLFTLSLEWSMTPNTHIHANSHSTHVFDEDPSVKDDKKPNRLTLWNINDHLCVLYTQWIHFWIGRFSKDALLDKKCTRKTVVGKRDWILFSPSDFSWFPRLFTLANYTLLRSISTIIIRKGKKKPMSCFSYFTHAFHVLSDQWPQRLSKKKGSKKVKH